MTTEPPKPHESSKHRKSAQEEVARSLERELDFLTEERKERARLLGLDPGLTEPNVNKRGE